MEENSIFVIFSKKDRKIVEGNIAVRDADLTFIYDDIQNAQSVIYFLSSASKKDTACQTNLNYAKEHNLPIETVNLGGQGGGFIAGLVLLAALALVVYLLAFQFVPNLIGSEPPQAVAALAEHRFPAKFVYDYSDDYPIGLVCAQNRTNKWMPFLPVTVTVSLGGNDSLTTVPETVGLSLSGAVDTLREAGFEACRFTVESASDSETGTVTSQIIPAGYAVSSESVIGLTVRSGSEALTLKVKERTVTLPTTDGDSLELDFKTGTTKLTEAYVPKEYENAVYIYGKANEYYDAPALVYDQPVIIEGDNNAVLQFWQETVFNDDVLIRTGNNAVFVIFGGSCTFNGHLYFENTIMQATEDTVLPTIMTDIPDISVEVLHGSASLYMMKTDTSFVFNGKEYSFDDSLEHQDLLNIVRIAEDHLNYLPDDPNMHIVTQRSANGEVTIEHKVSHLDMF